MISRTGSPPGVAAALARLAPESARHGLHLVLAPELEEPSLVG